MAFSVAFSQRIQARSLQTFNFKSCSAVDFTLSDLSVLNKLGTPSASASQSPTPRIWGHLLIVRNRQTLSKLQRICQNGLGETLPLKAHSCNLEVVYLEPHARDSTLRRNKNYHRIRRFDVGDAYCMPSVAREVPRVVVPDNKCFPTIAPILSPSMPRMPPENGSMKR